MRYSSFVATTSKHTCLFCKYTILQITHGSSAKALAFAPPPRTTTFIYKHGFAPCGCVRRFELVPRLPQQKNMPKETSKCTWHMWHNCANYAKFANYGNVVNCQLCKFSELCKLTKLWNYAMCKLRSPLVQRLPQHRICANAHYADYYRFDAEWELCNL